ncbi:MAG: hypothetical protein MRJ65_17000 [Candidatus Brocadiaceae bacterium]|nr:hypothetical protein [Candidatus Brocadiaceae bacterium]
MNRKQYYVFFIVIVLVVSVTGNTFAKAEKDGVFRNLIATFKPPTAEEQESLAKKLKMTDDQKFLLKNLNKEYQRQVDSLSGSYNKAYDETVSLMQQEVVNEQAYSVLKSFHDVHSKIVDTEVEYWRDIKLILTPEQNKEFWKIWQKGRVAK